MVEILFGNNTIENLTMADKAFGEFEAEFEAMSPATAYNRLISLIHFTVVAILRAEDDGFDRNQIRSYLPNPWRIFGYSSFGQHIQTWPLGYVGDYQIVNAIIDRKETAPEGSIGRLVGEYSLNAPITEQHREKIAKQAQAIKRTCQKKSHANILSLGSGPSRDFEQAKEYLEGTTNIVLCDFDENAIEESIARIGDAANIDTHVIDLREADTFFNILDGQKFDLILAGGLFDYFPNEIIQVIISKLSAALDGEFVFSNIAEGNPSRPWIEVMGRWKLKERTEEGLKDILDSAGAKNYKIEKDPTGLTYIVTIYSKAEESRIQN